MTNNHLDPDEFCCNPKCELNKIRDAIANRRREVEIISGMFGARRRKIGRVQYGNAKTEKTMYFCEACHNAINRVTSMNYPDSRALAENDFCHPKEPMDMSEFLNFLKYVSGRELMQLQRDASAARDKESLDAISNELAERKKKHLDSR